MHQLAGWVLAQKSGLRTKFSQKLVFIFFSDPAQPGWAMIEVGVGSDRGMSILLLFNMVFHQEILTTLTPPLTRMKQQG